TAALSNPDVTCYQMDLYQAARLQEELKERHLPAHIEPRADLWDLPADFASLLFPAQEGGERSLKLDMVEQAWHVLRPEGTLIVLSPYEQDRFFPSVLRKVFGKFHSFELPYGQVFWCHRRGDRARRRHEITFQVRGESGTSLRFLSRPGVFSYGKFD